MSKKVIIVKKEDLRELYKTLTSYPNISKEQVANEMQKCFGDEVFKPKNVTERIKTFEDALKELGEQHPYVQEYRNLTINGAPSKDVAAYLKLRIIAAALNEGWKPTFAEDEWRYWPWFIIYSKEELDRMSEEERGRVVGRSSAYANAYGGVVFADSSDASSWSSTFCGSRLAFKTEELAVYCGKQFIDIWVDFIC